MHRLLTFATVVALVGPSWAQGVPNFEIGTSWEWCISLYEEMIRTRPVSTPGSVQRFSLGKARDFSPRGIYSRTKTARH